MRTQSQKSANSRFSNLTSGVIQAFTNTPYGRDDIIRQFSCFNDIN